jgi:hypothetical protein
VTRPAKPSTVITASPIQKVPTRRIGVGAAEAAGDMAEQLAGPSAAPTEAPVVGAAAV